MSAEPKAPSSEIPDQAIQETLVLLHGLSDEAIESINDLMARQQLRFADAALHTGLVTQEQLDEATLWARSRAMRQRDGIIQDIVRRGLSQRRDLVLWEGPKLDPSERLIVAHYPNHPRSESIRTLVTEILMRTRNMNGGILALVSPCTGEGRSQLAAELAIGFAQLGRKTLLVDADLRRPCQHLLFGADNDTGLTQALEGGKSRLHGIGGVPQMALLTSGAPPPNPLELLSGIRFEQLAAEWRRSFEYVILDTPPAAGSSDAIAVASAVGNVLVLSRANMTPFSALKEMSRKLETTHARTLGAVIGNF